MAQMIVDEARDEVVPVVVPRLTPQRHCVTDLTRCFLEEMRL